jgi:hypothetical protein
VHPVGHLPAGADADVLARDPCLPELDLHAAAAEHVARRLGRRERDLARRTRVVQVDRVLLEPLERRRLLLDALLEDRREALERLLPELEVLVDRLRGLDLDVPRRPRRRPEDRHRRGNAVRGTEQLADSALGAAASVVSASRARSSPASSR